MEVIKKGNGKPLVWSKKFECTGAGDNSDKKPCHSLLRVKSTDITFRTLERAYNYPIEVPGFVCPVCGCFTQISERIIPAGIVPFQNAEQIPSDR